MSSKLSNDEIHRYSRHLLLPEISMRGQEKLKAASVLVIGAGGLGSPLATYLAAAGIGKLGIVDDDVVDASNLQRQTLHGQSDIGRRKVASAAQRLSEINPFVEVFAHDVRLTAGNALDILRGYDVVADATDNFPTRYLVNDACVFLRKPLFYASIFRFEGQVSVFDATRGPCYRCLYPEPPPPDQVPSCAEGGVLGVLAGVIGSLQATEVLKHLLGAGDLLLGRLLTFDALVMRFRELHFGKDPECAVCGRTPTVTSLVDYDQFCGTPQSTRSEWDISPRDLQARLHAEPHLRLLDVREPHEWDICHLDGATLIPLEELPRRLHELDTASEWAVYCKTGQRSRRAVQLLRAAGFKKLHNLQGGINRWSDEVDPHVARY